MKHLKSRWVTSSSFAAVALTGLWLAACSDKPKADFAKCAMHKIAFPGNDDLVYFDCAPLTPMGDIKRFRFTEMPPQGSANVMAFADGNRPVYALPDEAAAQIVAYGIDKYAMLRVMLPPSEKTAAWTSAGWTLKPTPQGVMATYTKR
jgi:hypothetical protein